MAADTSVTQFFHERVTSSLEELMNIKFSFLIQFLVSVTLYESKHSGQSINLGFRYLVKLTSYEMFEVSFWKVLPLHGSLIKKKKKKKKKKQRKKKKEKKYIYIRTFPAYFLVTSMGKYK